MAHSEALFDPLEYSGAVMTSSCPIISVVLPIYNGKAHLGEAIQSVIEQKFQEWELLMVDDGSEDASLDIAKSHAASDARVHVYTHRWHRNRGVAASRNKAIDRARGKYIAFIDQDDLWKPAKLDRQVQLMEAHPDIALCFTLAELSKHGVGHDFLPGVELLGDAPSGSVKETFFRILNLRLNYIFSSVMVRTDVLRLVGGMPENTLFQSDDRLMVAKIAYDHLIGYLPESLSVFRAHNDHYTISAIRAGIGPVLIYDLQSRLFDWLLAKGHVQDAETLLRELMKEGYFQAHYCLIQQRQAPPKRAMERLSASARKRTYDLQARCRKLDRQWRRHHPLAHQISEIVKAGGFRNWTFDEQEPEPPADLAAAVEWYKKELSKARQHAEECETAVNWMKEQLAKAETQS